MKFAAILCLFFGLLELSVGRSQNPGCLEKPAVVGVGSEFLYRWTFFAKVRDCKLFIFKGRKGNGNRFLTQDICEDECMW
ncbi:kunitz-type conkunitzin-B1-like isoform X1 [Drosophila hydei]|uniref:Kunitz-type conkunitzin-B1-like isoform X1 n=1 Tax=Drosophila hydei TaxID=7224 RepID=A0A6J2SWW1_DROHY|nr:kunitz-type conkunitzin-B1-like isoform X1 [Drosophila hydei]